MATENSIYTDSSKPADIDLSAYQYQFVKETATGWTAITANTDKMGGILQNDPVAGQTAEVMRIGKSKLRAAGVIAAGAQIGSDATGKGEARVGGTDTTKYVGGSAVEAASADGDIITVVINCMNVHRAA